MHASHAIGADKNTSRKTTFTNETSGFTWKELRSQLASAKL
jgi:hypothetical protein